MNKFATLPANRQMSSFLSQELMHEYAKYMVKLIRQHLNTIG